MIHIGTSGWSYSHWKENFFPKDLKTKDWLNFYSHTFRTVEVNTTFYHLPLLSTVKNWYQQVPKNFLFSIKASRYITHQKRLIDCSEPLKTFYKDLKPLKEKQGPILFQLPPSFQKNSERLSEFIGLLNPEYQHVFEFRHSSWYDEEIYELLTRNNIALCITDLKGKQSPEVCTGPFIYIRLHGPQRRAYKGSYGPEKLRQWKKKLDKWSEDREIFCYFDNDEKGYAPTDAQTLMEYLSR